MSVQHDRHRWVRGTILLLAAVLVAPLVQVACTGGEGKPAGAAGTARSMQLISDTAGWVLTDQRLTVTGDAGLTWRPVERPAAESAAISDVDFIDGVHGWALVFEPSKIPGAPQLSVARTADGGSTWQAAAVNLPDINDNLSGGGYVSFLDSRVGWVVAVEVTGAQFSSGALYRTVDGGATWEELNIPLGEPVTFVNERDGFVTGGPAGDKAFATHDGGTTWEGLQLDIPAEFSSTHPVLGRPVFFSEQEGVLPASFTSERSALGFYATSDGGRTWGLTGSATTGEPLSVGVSTPVDAVDADTLIGLTRDGGKLFTTTDKGSNWTIVSPNGLPSGVAEIDFASAKVGWALVQTNTCLSFKSNCIESSDIYKTSDGGQTWAKLDLGAPVGQSGP